MKRILSIASILISLPIIAQEYWQQEVNYNISVQLNDEDHMLTGFETFEYVNNSPEALDKIYIHLWPNAYKDDHTALADQLYSNGNGILEFADDDIKGYIDSLNFTSEGKSLKWEFEEFNIDIAIIYFETALKPGERINISTPFKVKIPSGAISRLGHIGQSYQITQWYPKPAVYDDQGWHHMPYLNQGEFFSEYGSFDVKITLPENYVVGATGDLQTPSEIEFMNERAKATAAAVKNGSNYVKNSGLKEINDFPESSTGLKTIQFKQSNVHDFAWFADKRFQVLKSEVEVPHSKRKVTSWALYTPKNSKHWSNASEYINDAVYYYSLWNGDYPYNNVTAVDGTISAGGGMEYPNITVIGNASNAMELEVVIVHEVGHNWFYGQLGSNERVHGWMDEGMNTLNEVRYVQTKYPNNEALTKMISIIGNMDFHFNDLDHHDQSDIAYRLLAYLGEDQPVEMHSAKFTQANYGVVMYMKTGLVFYYLKDYLGEELFDSAMQEYYRQWEFKHPRPEHMRQALEKATGKDLNWLFEDLIKTTKHVEFKYVGQKKTSEGKDVIIRNKGEVDGPVEVVSYLNGEIVEQQWSEPGQKKHVLHFNKEFDALRIDPGNDIPEINRNNNLWKKGLFGQIEPLKFEFFIGDNEPEKTNIFWSPMLATNAYDRFMMGGIFHNMAIVPNKFSFIMAPMYSFGRNGLSGFGEFAFNCVPAKYLKQSRIGFSVKSFKNDTLSANNAYYVGITPFWKAKIGNRGVKKHYHQNLKVQGLYRYDQLGSTNTDHVGGFVNYQFQFNGTDHDAGFQLRNEYVQKLSASDTINFDRILLEGTYSWRYLRQKGRRVHFRAFAGYYLVRNIPDAIETNPYSPYSMSLSGSAGYQDLFLENYYLGRNEISGFYSGQRAENMGGFKSNAWYGTTTHWMVSGNFELELPYLPKVFQFYADYGLFFDGTVVNEAYQGGLAIKLNSVLNVYFPLFMNKELVDSYGSSELFKNYGAKIRFTLNLNVFDKPFQLSQFLN